MLQHMDCQIGSMTSQSDQDCHLLDWLESMDKIWLARDTFAGEKRAKLFSCLAFNCGWLPEDSKVSYPCLDSDFCLIDYPLVLVTSPGIDIYNIFN